MKLTVTPDDGQGPVENLDQLGALIEKARTMVAAADLRDDVPVRARVRLNLGQTVKAVELSW